LFWHFVQALDALIKRIEFNSPPIVVDLSIATQVATTVEEAMVQAVNEEKDYYLYYFCSRFPGRTVVFVNAISCLRRVLSILSLLKLPAFGLHANMQQKQRLKNLERFKSQENAILVATDVAARGLDIPLVQHVLHYQLPRTSEVYVHRAGRAGRAQAHGYSVAMVGPDEVKDYRKICEVLNKSSGIPPLQVDMAWMASCRARVTAARKLGTQFFFLFTLTV
jgi:ATP-dependent RNA helicase DDX24/MAK5